MWESVSSPARKPLFSRETGRRREAGRDAVPVSPSTVGLRFGLSRHSVVVRMVPRRRFQCSPFKYQADGLEGEVAENVPGMEFPGDEIIQVGGELEPPAVEAEVEDARRPVIEHGDRAEVADQVSLVSIMKNRTFSMTAPDFVSRP